MKYDACLFVHFIDVDCQLTRRLSISYQTVIVNEQMHKNIWEQFVPCRVLCDKIWQQMGLKFIFFRLHIYGLHKDKFCTEGIVLSHSLELLQCFTNKKSLQWQLINSQERFYFGTAIQNDLCTFGRINNNSNKIIEV